MSVKTPAESRCYFNKHHNMKLLLSSFHLNGHTLGFHPGEGGGHIWAIMVCAAVKGMVFKQFTLA